MPVQKNVEVLWHVGHAKNYTDVIPLERFAKDVSDAELHHLVRGPHGGSYYARCSLTVSGSAAVMDYRCFADFNLRSGMQLGIMGMQFPNRKRTEVPAVSWNQKILTSRQATVSIVDADGPSEVVFGNQRRRATQILRPGQAKFRSDLDLIYGARCCISGCPITWSLEAAHITPYAEISSNFPEDGLLLRADLHALFDANQLAIHPTKRLVYFAPGMKVWPEYENLHGRRLVDPMPGYGERAPHNSAFKRRWLKFIKAFGTP